MHPLDGVRIKINRANEHIAEYWSELQTFRKTNPYSVREDIDTQSGNKVWIVNSKITTPPLSLSAIIGDAIHNFRSTLDYLAWQLVIANGGIPDSITAFPICTKSSQWGRAQRKLQGMNYRAKAIIKSEQPCFSNHFYRRQWFTWLEELDIMDKHKYIQITQTATGGGLFSHALPLNTQYFIYEGIVQNGTKLASVPQAYSYVNFNPAIDISFGDGTSALGESVYVTLHDFNVLVEDTVTMFKNFFH